MSELQQLLQHANTSDDLLVTAPMREGKTHAIITAAVKRVKNKILYIAPSHEVAKHAARKFAQAGAAFLHLAGTKWQNFDYVVNKTQPPCLTPKNAYKIAKEQKTGVIELAQAFVANDVVHAIVTVPQMAVKLDPTLFNVIIFDEAATLEWFKTKTLQIFEYNKLIGKRDDCNAIERSIKLVKEKKEYFKDKTGQAFFGWLQQLNGIIDGFWALAHQLKQQGDPTPYSTALRCTVKQLNQKPSFLVQQGVTDPSVAAKIIEEAKKMPSDDESTVNVFELVASLVAVREFKAVTTATGGKIYAVTEPFFLFKDWLTKCKRIWVVCDIQRKNEAEWFYCQLGRQPKLAEKREFRFRHHFMQFIYQGDFFELTKYFYDKKVPVIHVVGRKKDAEQLRKELERKYKVAAVILDHHGVERAKNEVTTGNQIIVYTNSRVSKGVDLPFVSVVMVWGYYFAVPEASNELEALKKVAAELEQVIMRCSPVDPNDPVIRYIIWQSRKRRASKAEIMLVTKVLQQWGYYSNIKTKIQDVKRVLKSNWLPLVNLAPQIPIPLRRCDLELIIPFCPQTKIEPSEPSFPKINDIQQLLSSHLTVYYTVSGKIKIDVSSSFLQLKLLEAASTEKDKRVLLKLNPTAVVQFLQSHNKRQLSRKALENKLLKAVTTKKAAVNALIRTLVNLGYLKKIKNGKTVIYVVSQP